MIERDHIIEQIRRTAATNGGRPLGRSRFQHETGIRTADWEGRYWARWGDAQAEAGFAPNTLNAAFDSSAVVARYIALVRKLGRIPVNNEIEIEGRSGGFPNPKTITHHLGRAAELRAKLRTYCSEQPGHEDVLAILDLEPQPRPQAGDRSRRTMASFVTGTVYLLRSGRNYKIGRTNALGRREYEINLQLPTNPTRVHEIETDDPAGIEAYWHRRFADRRKRGEWFALTPEDVAAFRRRGKYM